MSNSLRKVIELAEKQEIDKIIDFEDDADGLLATFCRLSESAICFDCGDAENLCKFSIQTELQRLPYDRCWFEFQAITDKFPLVSTGIFCVDLLDGTVFSIIFNKRSGREWVLHGYFRFRVEDNKVKTGHYPGGDPEVVEYNNFYSQVLYLFLSALNCSNVKRIESKPPEKLNKKRKEIGKKPIFSTWTLHIDLDHPANIQHRGTGTHASPRVHLRRGHIRRYKNGKFIWIQALVVGNKKLGLVHKDYAVA